MRVRCYTTRWIAMIFLIGLAHLAMTDDADAWNWKLDAKLFQQMDVFQRADYEKAERFFRDKNYESASIEFDKFTVTYQDSPALSAAYFMIGYSKMNALKRNEGIKAFKRVWDFFPDDKDFAPAAMYFAGKSYIDNGDLTQGLKLMRDMIDHKNKAYRTHELAASALNLLATNARENKELPKYYKYATQIYDDFYDGNRRLADQTRDELVRLYIKDMTYSKIESLVALHNWKEPVTNAGYHYYLFDRAFHESLARYFGEGEGKERQAAIDAYWKYWTTKALPVTLPNNEWESNRRTLQFLLRYKRADKEAWTALLKKMVGDKTPDDQLRWIIATLLDSGLNDLAMEQTGLIKNKADFLPWFFNELLNRNQLDHAEHVANQIEDPGLRTWNIYQIRYRENNWGECIKLLNELANNYEARVRDANWALVSIYKDRTGQYTEAIKLLTVMDEPPRTTFEVAECYRRAKDMKKSAESYWEIENFFPDQAPEAAWRRAMMYHSLGDAEKCIADCKRVLKIYAESRQASQSHEHLESHGVRTGLGQQEK